MSKTVTLMNQYLSDLHVMYVKLHNFHWNIVGQSFFTLHTTLENLYDSMHEEIDSVAERILMVGGRPLAQTKDYLANAKISEVESKDYHSKEIVSSVKADFEYLLGLVKEIQVAASDANDNGTVAALDNSVANYEKSLWMLNSYLK